MYQKLVARFLKAFSPKIDSIARVCNPRHSSVISVGRFSNKPLSYLGFENLTIFKWNNYKQKKL